MKQPQYRIRSFLSVANQEVFYIERKTLFGWREDASISRNTNKEKLLRDFERERTFKPHMEYIE